MSRRKTSKANVFSTQRSQWFAESRNYDDIVKAEAAFFRALTAHRERADWSWKLKGVLHTVSRFLNDPSGTALNILIELDGYKMRSQNTPQKIYLGTKLDPSGADGPEATHFLCIAEGDKCVAKLHADYDLDPTKPEKKPSPHCQVGGRLSDEMRGKHPHCAWDEDADKPRMPGLPFCTALLWHWAFREFPQYEEASVADSPWWLKLIAEAEANVFKPFFLHGFQLTSSARGIGVIDALYYPTDR